MPLLIKKEENNKTILGWEISEPLENLISLSSNTDCSHLKNDKRKKEFLACRILLNIYNKDLKISYSKNGSPNLSNHQYISISHSDDLVCIIISDNNIGIDIEIISEKTLRTSSKFTEKMNLTKEEATLIWCIKEAAFKFHEIGNIDFKKDIIISELNLKKSNTNLTLKGEELKATYLKVKKYYLSYVCK
jgi:phosphopantetheinyl transferase